MLEKPDLADEKVGACLREAFGLPIVQLDFLPLGADLNTAVYRAVGVNGAPYFVKLRSGPFNESAVTLPKYLSDLGISQIIAPLAAKDGQLWADLDSFKLILYPFVAGHNGYELELSDRHWIELGATLQRIHTAAVPAALLAGLPRESYAARWREMVRLGLRRAAQGDFSDPVALECAALIQARRAEMLELVRRSERLAQALLARPLQFVICHADLHAGNVLMAAGGGFYLIDWDTLILAPKERDLMSIGAGLFGHWRTPQEEETLFYRGYGPTQINQDALAYYRYERIIEDLAVDCDEILVADAGVEDRERSLRFLISNFLPNNTIEIAYESDQTTRK